WSCPELEPGPKTVVVQTLSGLSDVVSPVECPVKSVRTGVDVAFSGTLAVAGKVVWSDGSPIAGARVFAGIQPKPAAHTVETDADGAFRIGSLGPGICVLGVFVPGLPVHVEIKPAAGDENVRVEFPLPGSLSGRVVAKATGKPVTQFRASAFCTDESLGTSMERWVTQKIEAVL